ncbi:MAG: AlpA family phage regulatory protein [Bacillota bacterium]|nr:AlpA family phage regulatory protein [Bacillota bacterium]
MTIEAKLNHVALLLEKLLSQLKHPKINNKNIIDSPTSKLMEQFIEGIKSLRYLNSQINNNTIYYMTGKEVKKITGLSSSTLFRMEQSGKFPMRRRLGENSTRWLSTEVNEWILNREKVF